MDPILQPTIGHDGIPAHDLAYRLKRGSTAASPAVAILSSHAQTMTHAAKFVPAMQQTLQNAFTLSRTITLQTFLHEFDWKRPLGLSFQQYDTDIDVSWDTNLKNLAKAFNNRNVAQIAFRLLDYQRKFQIEKEINRRVEEDEVTHWRAEHDVYKEVMQNMNLSQGASKSAVAKSKAGIKRLHTIDEKHVAFILSRPADDG